MAALHSRCWARWLVVTTLSVLLGGAAAQDAAAAAGEADPLEGRALNVCVSEFSPIVRCAGREPSEFTG